MTNKVELVEVYTDDWVALYENGVNAWEGHRLEISDVLEGLVGSEVVSYKSYWVDPNLVDEFGGEFPVLLSNIKEEFLK